MSNEERGQLTLMIAMLGRHAGRVRFTQADIDQVQKEAQEGYQLATRKTPDGAVVFEYIKPPPVLVVEPSDVQATMAQVMKHGTQQ